VYLNGRCSVAEKPTSSLLINGKSNGVSSAADHNGTELLNAKNKSKDLKADQQLRQILGKDTFDSEQEAAKWACKPNVKRRPSVQVNAYGHHHLLSGLSSNVLADAGDEILESLVKTATTQSRFDNKKKTKSTRFSDRKSCK
jgi:hypothetical protein